MLTAPLFVFLALAVGAKPTPTPAELPEVAAAIAEFESRYPPRSANPLAQQLENLASELGIDLAPPLPERAHPAVAGRREVPSNEAGEFTKRQVEAETDGIGEPPHALRRFLAAHSDTTGKIVTLLSGDEGPRWELDVRQGSGSTVEPDSLGMMRLQKLLMAKVLIDIREARVEEASRAMEASWKLNDSLISRPGLVPQMIGNAVGKLQAGVLRKGPFGAERWAERMRFAALQSSFRASLRDDPVFVLMSETRSLKRSPEYFLYFTGMRRAAEALVTESACSFTKRKSQNFWKPFFPGEIDSVLSDISMPNISRMAHRFFRLLLEAEMTGIVLEARSLRDAAPDRKWPVNLPVTESRACSGSSWNYSVRPDGSMALSFAGRFADWPGEAGVHLPLSFVAAAASGAGPVLP